MLSQEKKLKSNTQLVKKRN